jgi:uncharacterized protein (DUF1501 family)
MKRRDFLKKTIPAAVIAPTILNGMTVSAIAGENPLVNMALSQSSANDKVLVLVQLSGGNDGLNTVVPLQYYTDYLAARTNIALPSNQVFGLSGASQIGLHPSMLEMANMFNSGELSIIHSVGYPTPNFSHFKATDIWMSASNSNQTLDTGWLGRYLDVEFPGYPVNYPTTVDPDPPAVQIGSSASLAFQGSAVNVSFTLASANSFYNLAAGSTGTVPPTNAGTELAYLRLVALQSQAYTTRLQNAYNYAIISPPTAPPTNNSLYDQLKIVAKLINGGLKTKVYMVSTGGYDTHANQANAGATTTGNHADLLGKLSKAIGGFNDLLKANSLQDRVLGMTISEFGRRIKSNGSGGTDHGAASPMFLFGSKVISGVIGATPTIPAVATVNDNVPYQYDFRQIYTSILQQWFCMSTTTADNIMLQPFPSIPIVQGVTCISGVDDAVANEAEGSLKVYPNPFVQYTKVNFLALDKKSSVEVLDSFGKVVYYRNIVTAAGVKYEHEINGEEWSNGNYYVRVFSGNKPLLKGMVKVQ